MNVFALCDPLVADYEEFTGSFITLNDDWIREVVDRELADTLASVQLGGEGFG